MSPLTTVHLLANTWHLMPFPPHTINSQAILFLQLPCLSKLWWSHFHTICLTLNQEYHLWLWCLNAIFDFEAWMLYSTLPLECPPWGSLSTAMMSISKLWWPHLYLMWLTLMLECQLWLECMNAIFDSDAWLLSSTSIFECHLWLWYLKAIFDFDVWMPSLTLMIECHLQLWCLNSIFDFDAWVPSLTLILECHLQLWCLNAIIDSNDWMPSLPLMLD